MAGLTRFTVRYGGLTADYALACGVHRGSGMKQPDPALARAIVARFEQMTDSDLARYMLLVRTIAACARFEHQARQARHAGCISVAQVLRECARDAFDRYAQSAEKPMTLTLGVTQ